MTKNKRLFARAHAGLSKFGAKGEVLRARLKDKRKKTKKLKAKIKKLKVKLAADDRNLQIKHLQSRVEKLGKSLKKAKDNECNRCMSFYCG